MHTEAVFFFSRIQLTRDRGCLLRAGRSQLRSPAAVFCGPGFWVSRPHIHHSRLWLIRPGCHGEGTRRSFCCSAVELVVNLSFVFWFQIFPCRYNQKRKILRPLFRFGTFQNLDRGLFQYLNERHDHELSRKAPGSRAWLSQEFSQNRQPSTIKVIDDVGCRPFRHKHVYV